MSFGQFIDPRTGTYPDAHLIIKAFEALRVQFGNKLPDDFFRSNWKRAELALQIEGRNTGAVVNALLPFAEAQCGRVAIAQRKRKSDAKELQKNYPHMARMIEKGLL